MKDTVQLHVDVSRELWRSMKVSAMDSGDTLSGVVVKALEGVFSDRHKLTRTFQVSPGVIVPVETSKPVAALIAAQERPKVDQKTCKHWFPVVGEPCKKCGWRA